MMLRKAADHITFQLIQVSLIFYFRLAIVCREVFSFQFKRKPNLVISNIHFFVFNFCRFDYRWCWEKSSSNNILTNSSEFDFSFKVGRCLLRSFFISKAGQTLQFQMFNFFWIFVHLTTDEAEKSSS